MSLRVSERAELGRIADQLKMIAEGKFRDPLDISINPVDLEAILEIRKQVTYLAEGW